MMYKSFLTALLLFLVSNLINAQNQKIYITRVTNPDNSVEFRYLKTVSGNYFIEFDLESVVNVADIGAFKKAYNLDLSSDSGTLFTLNPIDTKKEILYSFTYSYQRGLIRPQVDNSIVYALPFKENKKITIFQSRRFNVDPEIWKNYVVYSKMKDTICGMRKGIVTEIKKITVTDRKNTVLRTEVVVDHADGTTASYIGLDEKSLQVKLNDPIYPGTVIGTVDDVLDNDENHNFKFNIYYFSNEEVEDMEGKKIKIIERSVAPQFLTSDGIKKIESDENYTVKYNEDVLFKEMTPEEKSKNKIVL